MKEFSNGLTTMVQQEYYTAGGLTAESLIAKDPSGDLPEPSKFVKRYQLNYCIRLFDLIIIRSDKRQTCWGRLKTWRGS